jgi:hypothetical protein
MSEPVAKPIQVQEGRMCKHCIWFKTEGVHYGHGQCRRNEPFIGTVVLSTDSYSEKRRDGVWPEVQNDDWCGKYEWNPVAPAFVKEAVPVVP